MAKKIKTSQQTVNLPFKIVPSFFPLQPGVNVSPLVRISEVLQNQGISKTHLRAAIAILIGIMSSRWKDPVPMIITEDEGAGAVELLHTCLNLVPENSWIDITVDKKASNGSDLTEGKTIICYEAESSKDLFLQLLNEIELKNTLTQTRGQSISRGISSSSFVAITKNPNNPLLQNRYVTRIHISADQESKSERLKGLAKKSDLTELKQRKIVSACLRTLFNRIKGSLVDIEFADQIINKHAIDIPNVVPFYDLTFRLLRNITRINAHQPLRLEELEAAFIGLDPEDLIQDEERNESEPLKATKVDYYYFLAIFGEMFKVENHFITPRQFRIYKAIFDFNIAYLQGRASNRGKTTQEMLDNMQESTFSSGWLTREKMVQILQTSGDESISNTTLHNEIQVLLKKNLIAETKVPRKKNKSAYAAIQVMEDVSLFVTDPSEIHDSIFKKLPVQVQDIITFETVQLLNEDSVKS